MADLKHQPPSSQHGNNCMNNHTNNDEQIAKIDPITGYIKNIDDIVAQHYPNLPGTTYLDHAGTTPYPDSLVDAYAADLKAYLFGNPHSASSSSQLSSKRIDELRVHVLNYLDADPDEFDVVFVANATAAIKLVGDAFRDLEEGFWFGYHHDAHTSLVGVRELAVLGSRCMDDAQTDVFLQGECACRISGSSATLFAYAGQSNMTGHRYSLDWCRQINQHACRSRKHIYSLYDAAGLVSTCPLSLHRIEDAPDFTVISFYKIFGFPDLGGLIVRRSSADVLKRRRYFGGGTVDAVSTDGIPWHAKREQIHSTLEDGTLPFHSIIALEHAMRLHGQLFGDIANVARHTSFLASKTYNEMISLHHTHGRPLCKIYSGDPSSTQQKNGPTITFNLMDSRGTWISNVEVEKLGIVNGIQFRTGGLCNPGGTSRLLGLTTEQIKRNYDSGQRCGGELDIFDNQPTGTIRISFGASSSMKDVESFVAFLREFFLDSDLSSVCKEDVASDQDIQAPSFVIDSITVFPVKSCGGFSIPRNISWRVYPKGLQFDREWCLVHQGTNIALSQKQFPQMALLKPSIDLDTRTLNITYQQLTHTRSITIDLDNFPESEVVMNKPCERFKSQNSTICGETILVHVYTSRTISNFFSDTLGVPCTLARFPPEETAQQRRVTIRRPLSTPEPSPERYSTTEKREIGLKLSNESPILLVSRSSVDMLNAQIRARCGTRHASSSGSSATKVGHTVVSADSFRANIVIAEPPSRTMPSPYAEDEFERVRFRERGSRSSNMESSFTVLGPCQRCQMVCVDQRSGTRSQEPFSTLAKTRRKDGRVWFGMHLCLDGSEPVRVSVGDVLDVEYKNFPQS